jgi:hypothetical protein
MRLSAQERVGLFDLLEATPDFTLDDPSDKEHALFLDQLSRFTEQDLRDLPGYRGEQSSTPHTPSPQLGSDDSEEEV